MRSHCAVYVDVGYLLASVATRVTGTSLRSSVVISYPDLVTRLVEQAEQLSGLPLLRVNWYDAGTRGTGGASKEQNQIGMLPRVKLRLGRTSPNGDQKGVDLRIGLDLVSHGHGRAVDVIYLVSGDDDLTEAVEEAQGLGVQVVVLAVPDRHGKPYAVSQHLIRESDGIVTIDPSLIDETVHVRQRAEEPEAVVAEPVEPTAEPVPGASPEPRPGVPSPADLARRPRPAPGAASPAPAATPAPGGTLVWSSSTGSGGEAGYQGALTTGERTVIAEVCRGVVTAWATTATETDRRALLGERPYIPGDLDRTLLTDLSARLGVYDIGDEERSALREGFWDLVDEVLT